MKAIINLKLGEDAGANMSTGQRLDNIMSRLRQFFPRSIGEVQTVNGFDVAVIVFEFAATKQSVLATLYKLSKDFSHDFVPVLFCSGEGRLAGPGADIHGPFNIAKFLQPRPFYQEAI